MWKSMTREEINDLIGVIQNKVEQNVRLTNFEDLVLEEVKLAKKENREVILRVIEDYKFWMD